MGIDKYKVDTPSAFDRYYDEFLNNSLSPQGRRYKVSLRDGTVVEGRPSAGSFVDPTDPDVTFNFVADDGGRYRIPFKDLVSADSLD